MTRILTVRQREIVNSIDTSRTEQSVVVDSADQIVVSTFIVKRFLRDRLGTNGSTIVIVTKNLDDLCAVHGAWKLEAPFASASLAVCRADSETIDEMCMDVATRADQIVSFLESIPATRTIFIAEDAVSVLVEAQSVRDASKINLVVGLSDEQNVDIQKVEYDSIIWLKSLQPDQYV